MQASSEVCSLEFEIPTSNRYFPVLMCTTKQLVQLNLYPFEPRETTTAATDRLSAVFFSAAATAVFRSVLLRQEEEEKH